MKKVATVTWIKYYNFGTYLQAYALQQIVRKMGYDNYILDDQLIIEEGKLDSQKKNIISIIRNFSVRCLYKLYHWSYYRNYQKSINCYDIFRKEHLFIDALPEDLSELDKKYDAFIVGSDQIWFPSYNIFSPYYYLSFTNKPKIAYAPSIGVSKYPTDFIPKVVPLLNNFTALSVRESSGADLLMSFLDKKVDVVLDPTLLLDKDDWFRLIDKDNSDFKYGEYIFCYFLTYNEAYYSSVIEFSKKIGLPVFGFYINGHYEKFGDKQFSGGPKEFLTAIYNASYIFTDSFHCNIFSLIFEKKFYVMKRFKEGSDNNQNSRVENLLKLLNISQLFIGEDELYKIFLYPEIDYADVKKRLNVVRNSSIEYLQNALLYI